MPVNLGGQAAVVLEAGGGVGHVHFALDDRLAAVDRLELGEPRGVAPHQVRHLKEDAAPRLCRRLAPRPRIKGAPRRGDCRRDIVGRGLRDRRDRFSGGGVDDLAHGAWQDPRAVDEISILARLCTHGDVTVSRVPLTPQPT